MRGGSAFRRAVAASVGIHALLAVVLVVAGRWHASRPEPTRERPGLDTRVDMRIALPADETNTPVEVPAPPPAATPVPPDPPDQNPGPEPVADSAPKAEPGPDPSEGSRPPLARAPAVPQTLPPELLALLKHPPAPASDVVEVPVTPTPLHPRPAPGPAAVRPVAGTAPAPQPSAAARFEGGTPVHGPLGAGQRIVYVLDSSGSMGEWGKFDVARRALIATLRKQPGAVRFQLIVYEAIAFSPLPAPVGGCVPATADNVDRMVDVIRALRDPRGRSNHAEGLRKALELRPDFVLILTDADDLPVPALRGVVRQAPHPAVVCVAKVGADGVGKPVEVR